MTQVSHETKSSTKFSIDCPIEIQTIYTNLKNGRDEYLSLTRKEGHFLFCNINSTSFVFHEAFQPRAIQVYRVGEDETKAERYHVNADFQSVEDKARVNIEFMGITFQGFY